MYPVIPGSYAVRLLGFTGFQSDVVADQLRRLGRGCISRVTGGTVGVVEHCAVNEKKTGAVLSSVQSQATFRCHRKAKWTAQRTDEPSALVAGDGQGVAGVAAHPSDVRRRRLRRTPADARPTTSSTGHL